MSRTIRQLPFAVDCVCDRCGQSDFRQSDGDMRAPAGWKFVVISDDETPQHNTTARAALLCGGCVAAVSASLYRESAGVHPSSSGSGLVAPSDAAREAPEGPAREAREGGRVLRPWPSAERLKRHAETEQEAGRDWLEKALRALAKHHDWSLWEKHGEAVLVHFNGPDVFLRAGPHCVGAGRSIGIAIEDAISKLSDAELAAAWSPS